MNIRTVKELIRLMKENDLTSLALETAEGKIALSRQAAPAAPAAPAASAAPAAQAVPAASAPSDDPGMDFSDVTDVTAPMVGVFYAAPAPGQPPFVQVGSRVKKGDVLCILEAMKLMNEITADRDGQIVDVCAADGDVVEFGQPLFKLY